MRMYADDDPRSNTAETGVVALDGAALPVRSELLDSAMTAGSMIASTLDGLAATRLRPETKRQLDERVAAGAGLGAYAGLALWTLNAMTVRDERTGQLAETLTGLGIGLLAAHG